MSNSVFDKVAQAVDAQWVEKYRPKTLDDLVVSDTARKQLNKIKGRNDWSHILFSGIQGCGKTTAAKIIANDLVGGDMLYINASDENGIDVVRDRITNFAKVGSLHDALKVVILDECLEENTLVHIIRDDKKCKIAIKDLNPDIDLVKTLDTKSGEISYVKFDHRCTGERDIYTIELGNGEVAKCTGTHKWWVEVDSKITRKTTEEIIADGNKYILNYNGNQLTNVGVIITKEPQKAVTYDIGVDNTHSFFIGDSENGLLTSNCDGLSPQAQRALRNVTEEYQKNCRFILTANNKHAIITPLQSRCQEIDLNPPISGVLKLILKILQNEEVKTNKDSVAMVAKLVKFRYPDIRKIINIVQQNVNNGCLELSNAVNDITVVENIWSVVSNPHSHANDIRQVLIDSEPGFQRDYHSLLKGFFEYILNNVKSIDEFDKANITVIIGEAMYRHAFVMDPEINAYCALIKIRQALEKD